ncbi:hypothetical protein V8F20_010433 [Naviculisporaceae sp. PSN 640]
MDTRWFLGSAFQQPSAKKGGLVVKEAAALAAQKLREAIYLPPIPGVTPEPSEGARRIREVAEFLVPNFLTTAQTVIARFEAVGRLGDPVGKDSGYFADSQAWQNLKTGPNRDQNYQNFLIACSPDITETTDGFLNTFYTDNLRKDRPHADSSVLTIYHDIKAQQFLHPDHYGLAVTRRSEVNPAGERRTVPKVIYLHPLWLVDILRKHNSLLVQQADVELVARPDGPQAHREGGSTAMDTLLNWGVEGTVLHELFRLSAFGRLHDIPGGRLSYGWTNNVNGKNIDNADLMAFLGLAIKITDRGYKVDQEGMITKY